MICPHCKCPTLLYTLFGKVTRQEITETVIGKPVVTQKATQIVSCAKCNFVVSASFLEDDNDR